MILEFLTVLLIPKYLINFFDKQSIATVLGTVLTVSATIAVVFIKRSVDQKDRQKSQVKDSLDEVLFLLKALHNEYLNVWENRFLAHINQVKAAYLKTDPGDLNKLTNHTFAEHAMQLVLYNKTRIDNSNDRAARYEYRILRTRLRLAHLGVAQDVIREIQKCSESEEIDFTMPNKIQSAEQGDAVDNSLALYMDELRKRYDHKRQKLENILR